MGFVRPPTEYLHANRFVDYLELHKVLRAADGYHFDRHFHNMLEAALDPKYGEVHESLTKLERDAGQALEYGESPSQDWPETFEIMKEIASACGKDEFVEALLGPSKWRPVPGRRGKVTLEPRGEDVARLRKGFEAEHFFSLPELMGPGLARELAEQTLRAPFVGFEHQNLGVDYSMDFGPTQAILHYLITDVRVLRYVESIAQLPTGTLSHFEGRVYRMIRGRDADGWHTDISFEDRRVVAISVSLTEDVCEGGDLLLRRAGFLKSFARTKPTGLARSVVFRISDELEHKVSPVVSDGSRTNFAGWFCARPEYAYRRWLESSIFEVVPSGPRGWARKLFAPR